MLKQCTFLLLFLIMLTLSNTATAQTRQVSGTIRSVDGTPVPGANIQVKKEKANAVSDGKGAFSVSAGLNDTLIVRHTAFLTKEVAVTSGEMHITLEPSIKGINEVVVVGYGTQSRKKVTGAVSVVKFDNALDNRPITNVSQALSGTATGIWVSQNSGKPGSDGAQLRVRGWGTLNNANPMVLVDGIEGSINEVNPNDIESVSILKDASSASIYGSKAANGVILITTKSGTYKDDVTVTLNSYAGVQQLGRRFDIIDNSAEYMTLWNKALTNAGGSDLFSPDLIDAFKKNNDPYKYPNTNFFNEVFKAAVIHEHNLSVRGGGEKSRYFISGNYLDQDGIMRGTGSKRFGMTMNLESKVKKWLTIGGRVNGMRKISNEPFDLGRVMYIFSNGAYPFTSPYTSTGDFGAPQAIKDGNIIVGNRNPLIETANGKTTTENTYFRMNAYANVQFSPSFKLTSNFSSQSNQNLIDKYNQVIYGYTDDGKKYLNLDYPTQPEASRGTTNNYFYVWYNALNYQRKFGEKHEVSALIGSQIESNVIKTSFSRRSNPPKEGLTQIDAGTTGFQAGGNMTALRMSSYFGRLNYDYDEKYLFQADLRADGSSRFQQADRWGYFPSFSVGWRITSEQFMLHQGIFSDLKLRASWGKLGNQNIDNYWPFLTTINQTNAESYNFGGQFSSGAAVTALVDPQITWESTASTNIGLDMSFLKNRLSVVADYFQRHTNDIIVQLPIPQLLGGVSAPFENIGKMKNTGIELAVNYQKPAKDTRDFGYSLGLNATYVENEVTKFRENAPDQLYLIREGYAYRSLYGFKAIGIYRSNDEANRHMSANGYKPKAGEIKFQDVNGDGKLDYKDKMVLGNTIPKYTFGANLGLNWRGFDLSILLQGIAGVDGYTQSAWTQPLGISGGIITKRWRNAWSPDNPEASLPGIMINNTWTNQESSFWVADMSFVKLRNVQLGYTIPASAMARLGMQKLYMYVNAQNVFTLASRQYEGFDPERSTFDSGGGLYPTPRIVSFGINATF